MKNMKHYVENVMKDDMKEFRIVCLCGSTKFKTEFIIHTAFETLKGNIVLSVGLFNHADNLNITEDVKSMLDEMHFRKIELSDEILVLNVNGYIGKSTENEIEYAKSLNKKIRYLERTI